MRVGGWLSKLDLLGSSFNRKESPAAGKTRKEKQRYRESFVRRRIPTQVTVWDGLEQSSFKAPCERRPR